MNISEREKVETDERGEEEKKEDYYTFIFLPGHAVFGSGRDKGG